MSRLYGFALVSIALCIGFGAYHGYQPIQTQAKKINEIPELSEISRDEWQSAIQGLEQFAAKAELETKTEDKQDNDATERNAASIKNAKLVGIFIDEDTSAIIMSGKAPAASAERYRVDDRFDQTWRLVSINNTSITWLDERDNVQYVMQLFDPSTPEN
jgi:hypothetical protein